MKNIVHVSREKLFSALQKHAEILSDDPYWQEEMARMDKLYQQEKLQRETAFALSKASEQPAKPGVY